jgi:uncharacterized protein (DUF983 family)
MPYNYGSKILHELQELRRILEYVHGIRDGKEKYCRHCKEWKVFASFEPKTDICTKCLNEVLCVKP